jgi:hypothetical protein
MGFFSNLFGNRGGTPSSSPPPGEEKEDDDDSRGMTLQTLLEDWNALSEIRLKETFQSCHTSMSEAKCGIILAESGMLGEIEWGDHAVKLIGFAFPMPVEVVERCVAPAHYSPELKERARAHQAHVLLYYEGRETSPLEQYVALAAVAGALSSLGATVVLNEAGHTSFPAAALCAPKAEDGDLIKLLRELPLPLLYCGFVKHDVEGIDGVWMRTYGAPHLGLPDFATHATGHREGASNFNLFNSLFNYLQATGAKLTNGHTLEMGTTYYRVRTPGGRESFLMGGGEVFIVEVIRPDEINT